MRLLDGVGAVARRVRGFAPRDERQARFMTRESLAWMRTHKAYSRGYWMSYWRLFLLRVRRPDIITEGMVFITSANSAVFGLMRAMCVSVTSASSVEK